MCGISIICAVYNAQNTIRNFLNSIKYQTCNKYELIIVDGCSTDNTFKIISEYKNIVSKYVSESDDGIYDAWNKGINIASYAWISFVGADDVLKPNYVRTYIDAIKLLKGKDVQYISSKANYVDSNNKVLKVIGKAYKWYEFKNNMTTAHVGSLHNKNLFKEIGLYNTKYKIVGDYELLLRKGEYLRTLFINEVTLNMTIGGVSFSTNALLERFKAQRKTAKISFFRALLNLLLGLTSFYVFKLKNSKYMTKI